LARLTTAGILIAAMSAIACGDAEPASTHQFEVETVGGVEIATNRGGPRFTEPLFTLEEELTLVQDIGNEESLLYQPSDFARGGDGNYYVADSGNSRIAVFDVDGQFLYGFGRSGQGPGEFSSGQFSNRLLLQAPFDVEIQVFDPEAQRTQRFAFDGTLIEAVAVHTEGRAESLVREPDGTLVFTRQESERGDDLISDATIIGVIPPGADSPVAEVATATMPTFSMVMIESEEFSVMVTVQVPFGGVPLAFRRGEELVLVNGDVGQVEWRAADGTLRRRSLIERTPLPVTEAMRQIFAENFRAARARDEEEGRNYLARAPEPWHPEVSGWWSRGTFDDAGYLWLQDAAQASASGEGDDTRYEILSPEGEYLGHVMLPFTAFRVQDGTILARDTDPATDEVRLRVFRLRPSAPGFAYAEPVG